jgi:hypothetical protein
VPRRAHVTVQAPVLRSWMGTLKPYTLNPEASPFREAFTVEGVRLRVSGRYRAGRESGADEARADAAETLVPTRKHLLASTGVPRS